MPTHDVASQRCWGRRCRATEVRATAPAGRPVARAAGNPAGRAGSGSARGPRAGRPRSRDRPDRTTRRRPGLDQPGTGRDVDRTRSAQRRGPARLLDLVGTADVLMEGFRPGRGRAARRRARRVPDRATRGLVYARMTGWGQDGPLARTGRARHQLPGPERAAARDRDRGRRPDPAAEPGRRLRRRLDVPGRRHPGRAVGTRAHRARPGGRRGHGGRRRPCWDG